MGHEWHCHPNHSPFSRTVPPATSGWIRGWWCSWNSLGRGTLRLQQVLGWLQSQLLQPSGNKGEYYDQASGQIREYDKVNWVYPTNLFIKVSGQAPKVKVDGKDYYFLHPAPL